MRASDFGVPLSGMEIVDPPDSPRLPAYVQELYRLRRRHGVTQSEALDSMRDQNAFGSMMVHMDDADALVSGLTQHYPDTIRPALQIIGPRPGLTRVCGVYCVIARKKCYFFADTTVNIQPDAADLAQIAVLAAGVAREFGFEPRIAMLSFSSFGSVKHEVVARVREAVQIVRKRAPQLVIDGEMQLEPAIEPEIAQQLFPFSRIRGDANVLIFPDLQSGNLGYKLIQRLGGAETIGPILAGLKQPVHVVSQTSDDNEVINMTAIAVVEAEMREADGPQPVVEPVLVEGLV
jgi:malate dehydrogenase (oxaloacetate-decarboxylating)(NADP+)